MTPARRPLGRVDGRPAGAPGTPLLMNLPAGDLADDRPLLDAVVGLLMACLGVGNLVQGQWARALPLLDLTSVGYILTTPLMIAAIFLVRRRGAGVPTLLLIAMFLFGMAEAAASSVAVDKRFGLAYGVLFVWLAAVLLLDRPRRVLWFCGGIVGLAATILLGQVLHPDALLRGIGRLTPEGLNPIGAGRLLSVAAIVMLVAAILCRGRRRLASCALLAVLVLGIVATSSRGPLLGLAVGSLAVIWSTVALGNWRKILITAICSLGALLASGVTSLPSRLLDGGSSGRDELYAEAVSVIVDHPFGVGWGNFYAYVGHISAAESLGESLYAHNLFLEVFAEGGVFAGVCLLAFFTLVVVAAWRGRATPTGLIGVGLLVCLLTGAMVSSSVIGNRLLWVVSGMIIAAACRDSMTERCPAGPIRGSTTASPGRAF